MLANFRVQLSGINTVCYHQHYPPLEPYFPVPNTFVLTISINLTLPAPIQINGISQYLPFHDWIMLLSISQLEIKYIRTSFLFKDESIVHAASHFINPSTDRHLG